MTNDSPRYSVVVPVYNSRQILPELHRRLSGVMEKGDRSYELIFVDDGSGDDSWLEISRIADIHPSVTGVRLMKNSGQGLATLAGMSIARGEYIVTLDDDLQHPPEELDTLIAFMAGRPDLDVVIGAPRVKCHSYLRRLGSSCVNLLNSWFLGKPRSLRFTGFRLMVRGVSNQLARMHVPYATLGPMILSVTRNVENVVVEHHARAEGKSGYNAVRLMNQTLANMVGYSMLPLRILALLGMAGIIASICFGAFFAYRYFFVGISIPGWTALMLVLLALSGFNFFAFSILGEYILRLSQIATQPNLYAIREATSGRLDTDSPLRPQKE